MGDHDASLRRLLQDAWDKATAGIDRLLTAGFTGTLLHAGLRGEIFPSLTGIDLKNAVEVFNRMGTLDAELLRPAFEAGGLEGLKQHVLDRFLFPTPDASSDSQLSDAVTSLRKAFGRDYEDPGGRIVSYVLGYVDECFQKWALDRNTWYAPCAPIVQSSGWGKSRVVKQLANHMVVFYFSLLKPTSTGYPRSNPDMRTFFMKLSKPSQAYAIFWACFDWLAELESLDTATVFQDHQDSNYSGILERILAHNECTSEEVLKACRRVWHKFSSSLRNPGVQFLFVVDEARELFSEAEASEHAVESAFTIFRRACNALPAKDSTGSFVLFIDTNARVGNFTPVNVNREDPSFRVRERGLRLFGPLSRLPTFNLAKKDEAASTDLLDKAAQPAELFIHGRPLWGAQLESDAERDGVQIAAGRLVNLAKLKLLGGLDIESEAGRQKLQSQDMALVVLGRLIGVDVCPQSMVAQELVASHMRICLHTSETREYVLTMALPEPVLAEAAVKVLRHGDLVLKHLQHLNSLLLSGIASAGERGELVARFLLVNAMHSLQADNNLSTPQSLEKFLAAFCGDWGGFASSSSSKHLKEAKVFFNAFYRFFRADPSIEDLKTFVRKGGAMICSRGQKAYDLYIPFVLPNPQKMYDLSDDNCIGCLGIQVKNRKDAYGSKSTLDGGMKSYQTKLATMGKKAVPSVLILLHLGAEGNADPTMLEDETTFVLHFEDIKCKPQFRGVLKTILSESPDPMTILKAEEAVERERETTALESILSDVYPKDAISEDQGASESNVPVSEDSARKGKRPMDIDPSEPTVKGKKRKVKG